MSIALRIFVCLLAFGAGGLAGYLGYTWMTHAQLELQKYETPKRRLDAMRIAINIHLKTQNDMDKLEEDIRQETQQLRVWPFMFGGAIMGLLGGLMALTGRPLCGAGLLIVGCLAPLAIYQSYWLKMPTLLTEQSSANWLNHLLAVLAIGGLFLAAILARLIPVFSGPDPAVETTTLVEEI